MKDASFVHCIWWWCDVMSQLRSTSRAKVQEHCSALWVWVQGRSSPRACILIMTLQGLSGGDAALCSARQSQLTKLSTIFPSLSSVLITVAGRTLPSSFCASWTESTCWGQAVHFPPALGVFLLHFIYFYPRITLNLQEARLLPTASSDRESSAPSLSVLSLSIVCALSTKNGT